MEKLSGLILDPYDDASGEVLRSIFPSRDLVPSLIKAAHFLTPEDRSSLPDDLFALVLRDRDVVLRKYACVDAGNTALSIQYFLKEGHKLPAEAQKTAAENLVVAAGWYDLPQEEALTKVAFGMVLSGAAKAAKGLGSWALNNKMKALGIGLGGMQLAALPGEVKANLNQMQATGQRLMGV